MEMKKDWLQAVDIRKSRRTYTGEKIKEDTAGKIRNFVEQCNQESGLAIRFMEDGAQTFKSFSSGYGFFTGVPSYFAMVGDKDLSHLRELAGYYGELIVLECTAKGLGTCWVSGTFNKEVCRKQIQLSDEEELLCVIAAGPVAEKKTLKEKAIKLLALKSKKPEEFILPDSGLPQWVSRGIDAVAKAPSAMNRQPVHFAYESGKITASVDEKLNTAGIDLGIAMAHFELGAWESLSGGKWTFENGRYLFR